MIRAFRCGVCMIAHLTPVGNEQTTIKLAFPLAIHSYVSHNKRDPPV
jgi:hypothetical protein